MRFVSRFAAIAAAAVGLLAASPVPALAAANPLHIDIPVHLKSVKTVFNMDHPSFAGDEPFGLKYLALMTAKFNHDHTKWKVVAVFHGKLGYMLTTDATYDRVRHVKTGNPYKAQIEALIKRGVQIEECGVTAKGNHWGNADLLPGVKVDAGAVGRILQLVQDGYIQFHP
jgi:intracellular sulfur oxidation DsrE/DsrF family protein